MSELGNDDRVSRRRYQREIKAREEAERLLEEKSRALFEANEALSKHSETLEQAVQERTKDLQDALAKAEAASSARSRFIATMSHEIRTPLSGLLGMIDLLALDEEDPDKTDFLDNARASGLALSRIVNDVLDFSKMEAGLFVFENESVDIRSLIRSVLVLAQSNLAGQDRVIEALVDDSVPKLFLGDGTRIRQVISNLVSNAVRYSREGPITIRATASKHSKGALLRLEVEDQGVGIEAEKIEHLFKDFSQVSNPLTAAAQGTGLGLAISKRIIEGCGGTIGVVSKPQVGSTFWIELPVAPASAQLPPSKTRPKKIQPIDATPLNGKRVLLAEDNLINQRLLQTYLERMGMRADLAENGRVALEMFTPGTFDLLLLDVAMPEMDGLSLVRHLKAKWNLSDLPPIAFLTAHVMDAIEEDATALEVDHVLTKPIPFDELKKALLGILDISPASGEHSDVDAPLGDTEQSLLALADFMRPEIMSDLVESFDPEKLLDLVASYLQDSEKLLIEIRNDHQQSAFDDAINKAHSLKGSSRLLGFSPISDVAEKIELGGRTLTGQEVNDLVEEARSLLHRLRSAVKHV